MLNRPAGHVPSNTQGALPWAEHFGPSLMLPMQQSLPVRPGLLPQPLPPHSPHAAFFAIFLLENYVKVLGAFSPKGTPYIFEKSTQHAPIPLRDRHLATNAAPEAYLAADFTLVVEDTVAHERSSAGRLRRRARCRGGRGSRNFVHFHSEAASARLVAVPAARYVAPPLAVLVVAGLGVGAPALSSVLGSEEGLALAFLGAQLFGWFGREQRKTKA